MQTNEIYWPGINGEMVGWHHIALEIRNIILAIISTYVCRFGNSPFKVRRLFAPITITIECNMAYSIKRVAKS